MGARKSKTSYVVSNQDFTYERSSTAASVPAAQPAPAVQPAVAENQTPVPTTAVETRSVENVEVKPPEIDMSVVPTWLSEEYFVDILKENVTNFDKITDFKVKPALSAGENYATLMLRVNIEVALTDKTSKTVSYMLKVPHDTEQMRQMAALMNMFIPENEMYFDVVPELEEMYKAVGLEVSFGAKPYKFKKQPETDTVLLEDLGQVGYKNRNRLLGFDVEHTQWVLKKLAQFHAVSATRVATKGPYSNIIMKGFFEAAKPIFDTMMKTFSDQFLSCIKYYENGEFYAPIMKSFFDNMFENFDLFLITDPDEFNVINHGDCWANNILFKYANDGRILDTKFVDLQIPRYGSPAQDLSYFLMTSTAIDIKLSQFDHFLRYYHDNLIEHLKLLKYPKEIPTLSELHIQMLKYGGWGVSASVTTLPAVLLDPTEMASFDNFISDNAEGVEFKNLLFSNPRYRQHISKMLPWFYNRGTLEPFTNKQITAKQPATPVEISQVTETPIELPNVTSATEQQPSLKYPAWVTEAYFVDILEKEIANYKKISKFEISPATNAGDNYASIMLKVDIESELTDGTIQPKSFMLKIPLEGEKANAMMKVFNTFKKEMTMYDIVPQLENIYKEAGYDVVFGPKRYKFVKDPNSDNLLLENLRILGFKNADRLAGLDMEHTKRVLEKLAQFHAASAVLYEKNNNIYPDFLTKGMYNEENRQFFEAMGQQFYSIFYKHLRTFENSEEYAEKMIKNEKKLYDHCTAAEKGVESSINVLNHGDCWTNNIMYQYDDAGKIKNVYFVDFQISRYGTPAQDLYYFLLSSPTYDIKLEHFDGLIRHYYEHLVKNLKLLNYPREILSLKQLHIDLLKYGIYGVTTATNVMAAVLLDPTENASIESMLSETEEGFSFIDLLYTNPRYQKHANAIFTWLNRRGQLDFDTEIEQSIKQNSTLPQPTTDINVPSKTTEAVTSRSTKKDITDAELELHFIEVLKQNIENFDKITEFKTEAATKAGDNYASTLLRVNITIQLTDGVKQNLSYMLKIPVQSELFDDSEFNIFTKEIIMYEEYLPHFSQFYETAGHKLNLAPKYYKFKENIGCDSIILEDLRVRDFKIANRMEGLDIEHTESVLRKLAQFHAASAKHVELYGNYPTTFQESFYNEQTRELLQDMSNQTRPIILECACTYNNSAEYIQKLTKLLDNYVDLAIEYSKVNLEEFNVLNHGDCWINNIMFQYDEQDRLTETYLIDFQILKYGPPAYDLYTFLLSATNLSIKVEQFDYFISYYYSHLSENLRLLSYNGKIPTLKELHISLLKYGFMAVVTLLDMTSICLMDKHEHTGYDIFMTDTPEGTEFRKKLYGNPRFKAHAELVLQFLDYRGLLDMQRL